MQSAAHLIGVRAVDGTAALNPRVEAALSTLGKQLPLRELTTASQSVLSSSSHSIASEPAMMMTSRFQQLVAELVQEHEREVGRRNVGETQHLLGTSAASDGGGTLANLLVAEAATSRRPRTPCAEDDGAEPHWNQMPSPRTCVELKPAAHLRCETGDAEAAKRYGMLGDLLKQAPNNANEMQHPSRVNHREEEPDLKNELMAEIADDLRLRRSGSLQGIVQRSTQDLPVPKGCVMAQRVATSQPFEMCCALAIVANTALVGVSADFAARDDNGRIQNYFDICFHVCSFWFALELFVRLIASGMVDFFCGSEACWNYFDLTIVAADMFMMVISVSTNLSALRVIRLLKVARVLRVVKFIQFFSDLRLMIFALIRSFRTLFWATVLMNLIIYIFSIYLIQNVTEHVRQEEAHGMLDEGTTELKQLFGSLGDAQYVLFQAVTGGRSWVEFAVLLNYDRMNIWLFCFYVFSITVAVMNIITGIFVDTAIMGAQQDRDELVQESLRNREAETRNLQHIFKMADVDKSGQITFKEFEEHLRDKHVRALIECIGIEVCDARNVFTLLDYNSTGHVTIEEFVYGVRRLKGYAKSMDLVTLYQEHRKLSRVIQYQVDTMDKYFRILDMFEMFVHQCSSNLPT